MRHDRMHTKEFIIGATIGSLLGGVGALLIAPQAGKKLRQDICDVYCNLTHKTQDLADRSKSLAKDIHCQTCEWTDRAKSAFSGATKAVKSWTGEEEEEETTKDLLIGGVIGGVLGAVTALLLAPKSGEELREDLMDTYDDVSDRASEFAKDMRKRGKSFAKEANQRTNKWLELARNVVEDLTEGAQERGEDLADHIKGLVDNKRINEMIDWAQIGYRLWRGIQSKR